MQEGGMVEHIFFDRGGVINRGLGVPSATFLMTRSMACGWNPPASLAPFEDASRPDSS